MQTSLRSLTTICQNPKPTLRRENLSVGSGKSESEAMLKILVNFCWAKLSFQAPSLRRYVGLVGENQMVEEFIYLGKEAGDGKGVHGLAKNFYDPSLTDTMCSSPSSTRGITPFETSLLSSVHSRTPWATPSEFSTRI
jgi:hypothetical protein